MRDVRALDRRIADLDERIRQEVEVSGTTENRRVLGLLRSVFDRVETRIEDGSYQLRMPLRMLKPVAEHHGRIRILRHDVEKELVS